MENFKSISVELEHNYNVCCCCNLKIHCIQICAVKCVSFCAFEEAFTFREKLKREILTSIFQGHKSFELLSIKKCEFINFQKISNVKYFFLSVN